MRLDKKRLLAMSVSMTIALAASNANALGLSGITQTISPIPETSSTLPITPDILPAAPIPAVPDLVSTADIVPTVAETLPAADTLPAIGGTDAVSGAIETITSTASTETLPATPALPALPALPLITESSIGLPDLTQPATLVSDALATDPFNAVTLDLSGTEILGDNLLTLNAKLGINLLGLSLNLGLSTGEVTTPVPEPSSYALMSVGLLGLLMARRRMAGVEKARK